MNCLKKNSFLQDQELLKEEEELMKDGIKQTGTPKFHHAEEQLVDEEIHTHGYPPRYSGWTNAEAPCALSDVGRGMAAAAAASGG